MPVKDFSELVVHGHSLEAPLEYQREYFTPNRRFFVCSSGSPPNIDVDHFALKIWGDAIRQEVSLSYADLLAMPQHTVDALIECAGNHRTFFGDIPGKSLVTPAGTEELIWSTGAVGMARWSGVSLREVLEGSGISESAFQVCSRGSEIDSCEGEIRIPMPIAKALEPDTILALRMNGENLPLDHGFPVRLLVPGWIGAYSIKWLNDIEVRSDALWVRRNTVSYTLQGEHWNAQDYAPAAGAPITALNIKSSLALPLPAKLTAGQHRLHGYARSPGKLIVSVQWSEDMGQNWKDATLTGYNPPFGWVRFEFVWNATVGEKLLMTRATDESGNVQPNSIEFNSCGYLYNAVHPHPVRVV